MKRIAMASIMLAFSLILLPQAPPSFRYQTILRNNAGELLANKSVGLKMSILRNSPTGLVVYSETFALMTNALGLINLSVGTGVPLVGSIDAVDWGSGSYFMRIEVDQDGGDNYEFIGTSQLLSVPYALYAEKAGSNGGGENELYWKRNGSSLYYNDGNIGLGTANPLSKLNIIGNIEDGDERSFLRLKNYATGPKASVSLSLQSFEDKGAAFGYTSSNYSMNDLSDFGVFTTNGRGFAMVAYQGQIRFYTNKNPDNSYAEKMRIDEQGNVGIGTQNPATKLNIVGSVESGIGRNLIQLQNTQEDALSYTGIILKTGLSNGQSVVQDYGTTYTASSYYDFAGFMNLSNNNRGVMLHANSANGVIKFYTGHDDIAGAGIERMRIAGDGNVGIGTTSPTAKFEVADGDVYIKDINRGVIMTSPDGQCWRGTINNSGGLEFVTIACP